MSGRAQWLTLSLGMWLAMGAIAQAQSPPKSRRGSESAAPAARAPDAHARSFAQRARSFHPQRLDAVERVGWRLQRKSSDREIMAVRKEDGAAYSKAMRNSIEVLFQPEFSDHGHVLIRAGERVYDFPGDEGVRKQKVTEMLPHVSSPMYGFVFDSTAKQVQRLQRSLDAFIASNPEYDVSGDGPECYSCAGMVTSRLRSAAPHLDFELTSSAKKTARRAFAHADADGITLYGGAIERADRTWFRFDKIERPSIPQMLLRPVREHLPWL